jgi:hypothetical protein
VDAQKHLESDRKLEEDARNRFGELDVSSPK